MKIPVAFCMEHREYEAALQAFLEKQAFDIFEINQTITEDSAVLSDQQQEKPRGRLEIFLDFEEDPLHPPANGSEQPGRMTESPYQSAKSLLERIRSEYEKEEKRLEMIRYEKEQAERSLEQKKRNDWEKEKITEPRRIKEEPETVCKGSKSREEKLPVFQKSSFLFPGLVSVFSPVGGCGKTTLALMYAECLAKAKPDKKVLYWSIQGAEDWKLFFHCKNPWNMSDLIFAMMMDDPIQMDRILQESGEKQENGVYLIAPCISFQDLNLLSVPQLYQLLDLLFREYDYVVADMNNAFENVNEQILIKSSFRFYLSSDLPGARLKWRSFMENVCRQGKQKSLFNEGTHFFCLCEQEHDIRDYAREFEKMYSFPMQPLPWSNRLFKEMNGVYSFRQDSIYAEKIRQFV